MELRSMLERSGQFPSCESSNPPNASYTLNGSLCGLKIHRTDERDTFRFHTLRTRLPPRVPARRALAPCLLPRLARWSRDCRTPCTGRVIARARICRCRRTLTWYAFDFACSCGLVLLYLFATMLSEIQRLRLPPSRACTLRARSESGSSSSLSTPKPSSDDSTSSASRMIT
eukprot:scaffold14742_cov58-Phaeocystis_antarctica.AAC.6